MEEVDINQFINFLDSQYREFEGHFCFDPNTFLSNGDNTLGLHVIPDLDFPLSALEYLQTGDKQC